MVALMTPAPALAGGGEGQGGVNDDQLFVSVGISGDVQEVSDPQSASSVGQWVSTAVGVCGANGETAVSIGLPQLPPDVPPAFEPAGTLYATILVSPSGEVLARGSWNECTEPPPQPPPSAAAVFAAAAMPRPVVVTSPPEPGLVGIENWFWYEGPTSHAIDVTLAGWRATTTAEATGFQWRSNRAAIAPKSSDPGDARHPAARHVFTTQGSYDLQVVVTWTARFTFTGYGTTFTAPLPGAVDVVGPTRTYEVEEREAVVVG